MTGKTIAAIGVIILICMICYLTKQALNLADNVVPYNGNLLDDTYETTEGFQSQKEKLKRRGKIYNSDKVTQNEDFAFRKESSDSLADNLDKLYDKLKKNYKSMKYRSTNLSQVSSSIISLKKKIKKTKLRIKTIYPNFDFEDFNIREENIFKKYIHPYIDDDENVICFDQDKDTCVKKSGCKWNSNYRECERDDTDSESDVY